MHTKMCGPLMFTIDYTNTFCFYPRLKGDRFYGYFARICHEFEYEAAWESIFLSKIHKDEKTV